jgi:uncharacterized protein
MPTKRPPASPASRFRKIFPDAFTPIGMIHLPALPSSPASRLSPQAIAVAAAAEAAALTKAGFTALLIENMHDAPYLAGDQDPVITACMTAAALAVRQVAPKAIVGLQVLAAGHREALAAALASGAHFIRVENFVYAHISDEGLMPTAEAGRLLRYRRSIGAEHILLLTDIQKKHASHAITADISLAQLAATAQYFGSDGLIVTGTHTGEPTSDEDLQAVREASELPVIIGSGSTAATIRHQRTIADAVIVGSELKQGGHWANPLDSTRCRAFIKAARAR